MDIAATGFAQPLIAPLQDRPQPRPDVSGRGRTDADRDSQGVGVLSDDTGPRNERVVPGEVIYARPDDGRVRNRNNPSSGFTPFSGSRRFSLQAAVQTFRDNEALLTRPGQSRQVSGIIDEYV